MARQLNALREDNRTEEDIEVGIYRDSPKVCYNPNCTMTEKGRAEIARALDHYFHERGINLDLLEYHFTDSMIDDAANPEINQNKGLIIKFGDKIKEARGRGDAEKVIGGASAEMHELANRNPLKGFKTYVGDNTDHAAATWEDLVDGLNKKFEMLGSQARVNGALCKRR